MANYQPLVDHVVHHPMKQSPVMTLLASSYIASSSSINTKGGDVLPIDVLLIIVMYSLSCGDIASLLEYHHHQLIGTTILAPSSAAAATTSVNNINDDERSLSATREFITDALAAHASSSSASSTATTAAPATSEPSSSADAPESMVAAIPSLTIMKQLQCAAHYHWHLSIRYDNNHHSISNDARRYYTHDNGLKVYDDCMDVLYACYKLATYEVYGLNVVPLHDEYQSEMDQGK